MDLRPISIGPFQTPEISSKVTQSSSPNPPANLKCPAGSGGRVSTDDVEIDLTQGMDVPVGPIGVGLPPNVKASTTVSISCICCCWKVWPQPKK